MIDDIEKNRQAQKQREGEARLASAREHTGMYKQLAYALSDEVWAEVEKEIALEGKE